MLSLSESLLYHLQRESPVEWGQSVLANVVCGLSVSETLSPLSSQVTPQQRRRQQEGHGVSRH